MRSVRALALAGGVACIVAAAGGAQEIAPADAVRETLARDPELQLALAQVAEREGQYLEFSGPFDPVAFADSTLDYQRQSLVGEVLKEEKKRRIQLELVDRFFSNAAADLERILRGQNALNDENSLFFLDTSQRTVGACSPTQTTIEIDLGLSIDGRDQGKVNLCLDSGNDFGSIRAFAAQIECPAECQADPDCKRRFCNQIDLDSLRTLLFFTRLEGLSAPLDTLARESRAILEDQARIALQLVRRVAESARFARARLGGMPDEHEVYNFSTQLGLRQRLRNGIGITPTLELRALEENFAGKLRIVQFGDVAKSNFFIATARVAVDFPLGRNRGPAVRASELSAEANLQAARALAVQTASDQALETLRAYWNLSATEARVEALDRSVGLKRQVDESVGALIEADELPAVERHRSTGQLAQRTSDLAAAREAAAQARVELARAMGIPGDPASVAALDAMPLESFAAGPPVDPARSAELVSQAIQRRADVLANDRFVEANEILRRAAKVNLRPDVTLALNLSYSGLEESFDERYYDPEGFWKAASGKLAGPSYGVALRFTVPIGNNEARGRLVQADANVGTAEIQRADLRRTIGVRVHELAAEVDRARREVDAWRVNLDEQQRAVDSSIERLEAGDLSLIDVLTTEDQLTDARLGWIEAMRNLLELESRLRFETNTLLTDGGPEADPRSLELRPLDQPAL